MPLYDYRCVNCNHTFEVTHEVGGAPGPCPVCGGPVRRVFSSVGIIFKGSGFHTTDYRKSPATDGSAAKTPPGTEGGAAKTAPAAEGGAAKTPASPPPAASSPPKA
jgi:putative FmdB family regulatory protein